MKLEKAIKSNIAYPNKESIKPILLSVGVAMALSACTPPVAGGIPPKEQNSSITAPPITESHPEVEIPAEIAGGIPIFPREDNTSTVNK